VDAAAGTLSPSGAATRQGSSEFAIAWRLAAAAWIGCVLLQLALYARPSPYGGPFLVEWRRYFLLALYYELLGVWLLSAPFLALWLVRWRRRAPRHACALHRLQAALLTLNLVASQLDHEVLRYLGIRLDLSFLATYVRADTLSDSLFHDVLRADAGGAFTPLLLLLLVPSLYAIWAWRLIGARPRRPPPAAMPLALALLVAIVPLAAPANAWRMATGQFRLRKVEPVVMALAVDTALGFHDLGTPGDLPRLAAAYQRRWLEESADKAWRFPDPAFPYVRVPTTGAAPGPPWNVIMVQLETMRGMDAGFLNPARSPSPTPFLDGLARSGEAAAFTGASSFGQPSINGLFAAHCSITPHSRRYVTRFTRTSLACLPELLRRRGYRAEMFNAGDTDWDGATWWLRRWYDRLWRFPEAKEQDRPVFRTAARRIRALGATGRPFLAAIVSVSNHTPFTSREPRLDIAGVATPQQRILNTTRYTDDVVRELIENLRPEPWFARTIIVLYGDHGFNLGEHEGAAGELSLYRESVWVPLLILGNHPRLRRGTDAGPASLLDITPTIADLLGIREANPWQGHSLASRDTSTSLRFRTRNSLLVETRDRSLVSDPASGALHLYDRTHDWRQLRPLATGSAEAEALAREAEDAARLNDVLLRRGRVWPPAGRRPPNGG
jgi:phosphoglycerol transferase MdoB-like AlkP superfamily enzyme